MKTFLPKLKNYRTLLLTVGMVLFIVPLLDAQDNNERIPEEYNQTLKSASILKSASAASGSIEVAENTTYNSYDAEELVQNILVSGCLKADNVKFGYYYKSDGQWKWNNHNWSSTPGNRQLGYFNKGNSNFSLDEGIVLSTGKISSAEGPNDRYSKTDEMVSGARDSDLESITGYRSYDAAVLEFDFVPAGNTLEFKYVFASEEYREYACSDYNDAFGFFLTDPNGNTINLAKLGDGTPVTINNIHGDFTTAEASSYYNHGPVCNDGGVNLTYYIDNGSGLYGDSNNSPMMQFDGMTVVLTATNQVQAGETYHIKIAIADISDQKWDAGVFLEAKSFTSSQVKINQPDPVCYPNTVDLTDPSITAGSSPNLVYTYWEDEAATISYTTPSTATAGTYYIKGFNSESGCSDIQAVTVTVHNVIVTELTNYHNDLICIGGTDGSFKVEASGGTPPYRYSLDPTTFSNTTGIFDGLASGTYTVYAKDANDCETQSPVLVEITEPDASTCGITKDNCPPTDLAEVCFDGEGGTPVFWSVPKFSYSCCASGEGESSSFDVQFNIPDSKNSCWIYNQTRRIGSDTMRLWQSDPFTDPALYHGLGSDVFFVAPFQYFDSSVPIPVNLQLLNSTGAKSITWNLVVLKANEDGTAYSVEATYSDTKTLAAGSNQNPSETPWTIEIPANDFSSGVYKLKFDFNGDVGNGDKIEVDYLNYNAILSDLDGCTEGINFVVSSNYDPGDEFPIGTTQVSYVGTLTQPGGFTLSDTCTFDVVVNDSPKPTGESVQDFCSIDLPTVSDLIAVGNNIQWYADATGGQPLDGSTSLIDEENYYATQTIDGCESLIRLQVDVIITDPSKPTGESTQTFCLGSNTTIANLAVTGDNIKWYANESDRATLDETELLENGETYYATQTVDGCESDERLMVTVVIEECCTETVDAGLDFAVCEEDAINLTATFNATADSFKWIGPNGTIPSVQNPVISNATLFDEGEYIVTAFYNNSCEAKDTVVVTINDTYTANETTPVTKALCEADFEADGFTWGDSTWTEAGSKNVVFQTVNGCDSIVAVTLNINDTYTANETTPVTKALCEADFEADGFTWGDSTWTEAGSKNVVFQTVNGCDSIVAVTLNINDTYTANETTDVDTTICEADLPFDYEGTEFAAAGSKDITFQTVNGCDSIVTVNLTVLESTEDTIDAIDCDQLTINNFTYTESGIYVQHLTNAAGCDSTLTINVTILESGEQTLNITKCDSYTLNTLRYSRSGTYTQVTTNENGCDLVITLNLTILRSTEETIEVSGCNEVTVNDNVYTTSGTYTQNLTNAAGCDSTLTIEVTILEPNAEIIQVEGCETVTVNDLVYTTSGTYTQNLTNAAGCDSILTIVATILESTEETIVASDCQSFTINDETYTETGVYVQHLTNSAGCDSTLTINVTIGDTIAPTAVCADLTVQLDANGLATISLEDIENGSTDNCTIDTMFIDKTDFNCDNVGTNEVTLTVIDANGNEGTCTATVTVETGDADCGQVRLNAVPDVLTLVVCPGGAISGGINLLANDEGIGAAGVSMTANNLPDDVQLDITSGELLYAGENLDEAVIQFTYTICSNADESNCDTAEVTIIVLRDTDCDGVPDNDDIDDDDDGILDIHEQDVDGNDIDTDSDGIVDRLDIDSDDDGIVDNIEWQQTIAEGEEYARNGGDDFGFDYYAPLGSDSDGDGWDDRYDDNEQNIYYEAMDNDFDGIPDFQDPDADGDGIPDYIEGHDALPHDSIVDAGHDYTGTDSDNDGLDDAYDTYNTSDEWLHGRNAIGSNAPLQDMAGDTINNIRDWRDTYVPPIQGEEGEAEPQGCELNIPDGFSPNDDNYNDYFKIEFVCTEGEQIFGEVYPSAKIEIFNRWGNLVYEKERYGNTQSWGDYEAWWDGRSTNNLQVGNDKLPAGTYFYILYFNDGGEEPVTGSIFLNN